MIQLHMCNRGGFILSTDTDFPGDNTQLHISHRMLVNILQLSMYTEIRRLSKYNNPPINPRTEVQSILSDLTMQCDSHSFQKNTTDTFITVYSIACKAQAGEVLTQFIRDYGVPSKLKYDDTKEQLQKGTGFQTVICKKYNIKGKVGEPYHQNQNLAEDVI